MGNSTRAAEDVREEIGTPSFIPASLFVALMLPMFLAHRTLSRLRRECRTPFREPLQFIVIAVMSVISGTFPDTYRVFYMTTTCWCICGPSRHRHRCRHREK